MNKWIENNWNKTFALVPSSHPITELFVKGIHNRDYAGVDVTLTKLRCRYWTPKLKKYRIRRVKSKCMTCRKKITESQQMGQILDIRLKPAPLFYLCAVDLFGSLVIKYTVKKRTHGKEYGVPVNCLVSKAVLT